MKPDNKNRDDWILLSRRRRMSHTDKYAELYKPCEHCEQRIVNELTAGSTGKPIFRIKIGMTGFEPATPSSQGIFGLFYSNYSFVLSFKYLTQFYYFLILTSRKSVAKILHKIDFLFNTINFIYYFITLKEIYTSNIAVYYISVSNKKIKFLLR